ncbi:glycoside hydrolase family 57 protein [Thermosphaera chiliense]|uniref:glycoside hydrolase family 57 protein n=1 Tax=Thermosphaera chiliense TaxID=3402707 RepID=UPI001D0BC2E8|nr:glycoside hydrolase family 57 protein [Thermosphaera aggregans]
MGLTSIVFLFEVHQPYRLDRRMHEKLMEKALKGSLEYDDIQEAVFDNSLNKYVMERAAERCYIPATKIIVENLKRYKDSSKPFKVSFSISGVFLEQASKWAPGIIQVLQEAVATGMVELVEQTYYHSIAAFLPNHGFEELKEQVLQHREVLKNTFNYEPVSIENTEFTFNNDLACFFYNMGYKVIVTEGVDHILGWRSPNYVYKAWGCDARVLTRNYRLSDDVGFRFSDRKWDQYPLTADKYASWLAATPGDVVFLAMDYETFGEHHWPESGIHEFLRWLPGEVLKYGHLEFSTPREVAEKYPPRDVFDVPPWSTISWADERDLSAWIGNIMQQEAVRALASLYPYVKALEDPGLTRLWKMLTISDHFYYMATKFGTIEEVHAYFSPFKNASIAYGLFTEALGVLSKLIYDRIREKPVKVVSNLTLPLEKAFYFTMPDGTYTGVYVRSLKELYFKLGSVPLESVVYHLRSGHISAWISQVLLLEELSRKIQVLSREVDEPLKLVELVKKEIQSYLEG